MTGCLQDLRRRERLCVTSFLTFVVAFVAAPCLHTANHRPDHDHGREAGHGHPHRHDEGQRPEPEPPARQAPHGAGSLEHFGAVALVAPIFIIPPVGLTAIGPAPVLHLGVLLAEVPSTTRVTRGPPIGRVVPL